MKKACMIVYSYYPDDPRVRREAEALTSAGWSVDIICLRESSEPAFEQMNRMRVFRISGTKRRGAKMLTYFTQYALFFIQASTRLTALHVRRRYDLVQVHNMPDFLVFTALIPKLMGTRVILDIHDLVPELYAVKFANQRDHLSVRMMKWTERQSTRFASHVITVGETFRRRLVGRSVASDKLTVVMNSADTELFHPLSLPTPAPAAECFRLVYHGGVFDRYGLDVAVQAVARLRDKIPNLRFEIYGGGDALDTVKQLVARLNLQETVYVYGPIPLSKVPQRITGADLGVVPYRMNVFTELLYPTKAFEYIAMGIPVVMSRLSSMEDLFGEIPDLFVKADDIDGLAALIMELYLSPARRQKLLEAECKAYAPYSWDMQREKYLNLVQQLTSAQPSRVTVQES